jgi:hypothetical protein
VRCLTLAQFKGGEKVSPPFVLGGKMSVKVVDNTIADEDSKSRTHDAVLRGVGNPTNEDWIVRIFEDSATPFYTIILEGPYGRWQREFRGNEQLPKFIQDAVLHAVAEMRGPN